MESEAAKAKTNEVEVRQHAKDGEAVETKSPAVQTMEGYDPNRIPASVFSSSQGGDWSCASNESLFSIQMGNNSFSQDYAILYGTASFKSGELPRLDQWDINRPSDFAAPPPQSSYQAPAPAPAPAAKPTNPALRASNASAQSNASFAFPVLVSDVKNDYSVRPMPEKARAPEKPQPPEPAQPQSPLPQQQKPQTQHKFVPYMPKRWFSCFSCSRPRFCC